MNPSRTTRLLENMGLAKNQNGHLNSAGAAARLHEKANRGG
jgi:hypothetical protein